MGLRVHDFEVGSPVVESVAVFVVYVLAKARLHDLSVHADIDCFVSGLDFTTCVPLIF